MKMKNIRMLKNKKYYYYFRYSGKQLLIPLHTDDEIIALNRRDTINMYRKYLLSGQLSKEEVIHKHEVAQWFPHKEGASEPLTIDALSEKWFKIKDSEGLTNSSQRDNKHKIAMFRKSVGSNKKVKDITVADYLKHQTDRAGDIRPQSLKTEQTIIKAFLNWLFEMEYIDKPLKVKVLQPKEEKRPKRITEIDFHKLINEESIPLWVRNACKVYWDSGMRKMELIKGKIRGNRIVIDSEISKSRKEHSVNLCPELIEMVKEVHRQRDEFLSKGYQLDTFANNVSQYIIDGYKTIGIYEKHRTKLHSLRHSFGCRMYMMTADPKLVQTLMNHKDRKSTEQYIGYVEDILEDYPSIAHLSAHHGNLERIAKAQEISRANILGKKSKGDPKKVTQNKFHEGYAYHS